MRGTGIGTGLNEMSPIVSDIWMLGPQLVALMEKLRRFSLSGVNISLGAEFVLKATSHSQFAVCFQLSG